MKAHKQPLRTVVVIMRIMIMSHTLDTSGHTIFDIVLLYENLYPLLDKEILIVYWGPFVLFESS